MHDIDMKLLKCFVQEPTDINKLIDLGHDHFNPKFIRNFQNLINNNLISSNSATFGLSFSADKVPSWTAVDIYLTDKGRDYVFPKKQHKIILKLITENPTIATIVGVLLAFVLTFLWPKQVESESNSSETNSEKVMISDK
ncbi:hypothetical protein CWC11_07385 [Pseudoalteromonas sp. S3178]|uniref:hypothetical protein n=1 Tax=Pseudoalteromonas sp. S3178 TaxID=579532 RepID=UPI00110C1D55|nr:hypothetical protein [Pseudoalteromonas sp. S3178]TMP07062.1 hypothetical protein CWC11_07385 [Pseudoalteromonas sp. S3178]